MRTYSKLHTKRTTEDRDQAVLQLIPRDHVLTLPRVDRTSAAPSPTAGDEVVVADNDDSDRDDVTVRVASAVCASATPLADSCRIVDADDDDDDDDQHGGYVDSDEDVVRLPSSISVSDVVLRVPTISVIDDDDRVVVGMRVARDAVESFSATSAINVLDDPSASSSTAPPPPPTSSPPPLPPSLDELCWSAPARACARLLDDALDDEPRGDAVDEFDIDLEMPVAKKRGGSRASRLRLKVPLDVRGALNSKRAPTNEAAKRRLLRDYRDEEADWWFVLERGQHLLFDGVGANEQFVNDMVSKRVPPGAVMTVVSCEHPNTNMRQLLMALAHVTPRGASVLRGAQQGVVQQARKLAAYLDALVLAAPHTVPYYLVMHAIDAPAMNQLPGSHDALSVLCACRLMRVVATARSPRVALLWSHTVWRRMRWHSVPLSTLLPIRSELVRVGRHRAKQHASTRRSAVLVLSSVSSKARQIFAAFLRALLKHADEGGVKLSALYDDCHARFLVASMQELRQQLVEFRTHALITATGSGFSEKLACSLAPAETRLLLADIDELERGGIDAVDDDDDEQLEN